MGDLWTLPQTNLFAGLKPQTMKKVLKILQVRHVGQGDYVFRPGDSGDRLYFLHHGRVKTFILTEQGQEKIMHMFFPGDAFGGLLMGIAHGELPWAQALDDVVVSYMDEPAFKRFMQMFPDLCMNIFRYMASHHAEDMRRMERFIHTDAGQRLVMTLLDLGDRLGHGEEETFELAPCLTHEELSNMVGVARSTLSELISQLRRAAILGGRGRSLIVHRTQAKAYLMNEKH